MQVNFVTAEDISSLSAIQLVELLEHLLFKEVGKYYNQSEIERISVPKQITVADGGEDGRLMLNTREEKAIQSRWIKSSYTCFQCKATKMSEKECYREVIENPRARKNKKLKEQILSCIEGDGEYVLFTTEAYVDTSITSRVVQIKRAFKDCGIFNYKTAKVRILDANQICAWSNEQISAVILIQKWRNIYRPAGLITWKEWNDEFKVVNNYDFQQPDSLKQKSVNLVNLIVNNQVARVIGHKGIGKTRFVLESFNPQVNSYIRTLSESVVYADLARTQGSEIAEFILSHKQLEGILIVDNCDDDWHNNYKVPIKANGNLKLITINDSIPTSDPTIIILERKSQRETVRSIIKNRFGYLPESQIEYLLTISEGFPEMVPFLEKVIREKGRDVVFDTIPDQFIKKFIFGHFEVTSTEYELFKACSLFTRFKFYDDKIKSILNEQEKEAIKSQGNFISSKISKAPTDYNSFYTFCIKYRDKRQLLEPKGYYHSVIPIPIAVNLAAEWWEYTSFEYVENLIKELEDAELLMPMIERLKTLDQSERAKMLVSDIWGPNGPFATADILNTDLGSRIFRAVVELNPLSTMAGLMEAYFEKDINYLKTQVVHGRRNLVWALEKLVFRKETFLDAAKLMFKFAVAENEHLGNNATAQFLQLFHIYLPGTEADLSDRIKIITWGLQQENSDFKRIALAALDRCLASENFTRMGGAEHQGLTTILEDYSPKTWNEIFNYWQWSIELLADIAIDKNDEFSKLAHQYIASRIRPMFRNRKSDIVAPTLKHIASNKESLWQEAIQALYNVKEFDTSRLSEDELKIVDELIALLQPTNLKERIALLISNPPRQFIRDITNRYRNDAQINAETFAEELVKERIDITPYLNLLLQGQQLQSINFGIKLGELLPVEKKRELLYNSLRAIKSVPINEQNPEFIGGLLHNADNDLKNEFLRIVINDKDLKHHSFALTRISNPSKENYIDLLILVDQGYFSVTKFMDFRYGSNFTRLPIDEISEIVYRLEAYGVEGVYTALQLLLQLSEYDENFKNVFNERIYRLILANNILVNIELRKTMDVYLWANFIQQYLKDNNDLNFAQEISNQINDASLQEYFTSIDGDIAPICIFLVQNYFHEFWNAISNTLLSDAHGYLNLKYLLGTKNGWNGHSGILFMGSPSTYDIMVNWARENSPKGPKRLAYMMPISYTNNEMETWHPFAQQMIDEFGGLDGFMNELAANMGSFGMTGSAVEYYKMLKFLVDQLNEHPKPIVRKWSKDASKHYEKAIQREKLDNDMWDVN